MQIIPVVAALIRDAEGRYLVGQRAAHKAQGGKWEFMGGKIEPGSTPNALEHQQIRWVTRKEMDTLDFSPADRELIRRFASK